MDALSVERGGSSDRSSRAAFSQALSGHSTDELLAMIEAARAKDEELERQIRERREATSKEAIAEKVALVRNDSADVEDEPAPQWTPSRAADDGPSEPSLAFAAPSTEAAPATATATAARSAAAVESGTSPQQRVQQLEDKVAALLAENARVKTELGERDRAAASAAAAAREAQRLQAVAEAAAKEASEARDAAEAALNSMAALRRGEPIAKEELEEVRNAVAVQDKIVAALEQDNARLLGANKDLTKRLRDLERGIVAAGAKASLTTAAAAAGPAHSGGGNAAPAPETALELERARTALRESRLEVDVLRREKKQLEQQLGRVDFAKVESAELAARNAKAQLRESEQTYEERLQDMARKIAWYVEHQEFNRAQEELIKDQQRELHDLRIKVMQCESMVNKSGAVRTDKDRQIKQLQRRVVELEQALRESDPNSITELIRACRPTVSEQRTYKELAARIAELEAKLEEQEGAAQRTVDRLRVEADQVKVHYQQRLEKIEEEMRLRVAASQSRRVKEAEKALADARRYYSDKLKEQEQQILALRRGAPSRAASQPSQKMSTSSHRGPAAPGKRSVDTSVVGDGGGEEEEEEEEQEKEVEGAGAVTGKTRRAKAPSREKERARTRAEQQQQQQQQQHAEAEAEAEEDAGHAREVAALQATILELRRNLRSARSMVSVTTASDAHSEPSEWSAVATLQRQLQNAHSELAVHKRLLLEAEEAQRQTFAQWEERLLRARGEHHRALELLRQDHAEELARVSKAHRAELQVAISAAEQASSSLLPPSGSCGAGLDRPGAVHRYLQAVADRLKALEQQQAARELEARRAVEEVRRVAHFELTVERQKMALVVERKNNEIDNFRAQMDQLLHDLSQLRLAGGG